MVQVVVKRGAGGDRGSPDLREFLADFDVDSLERPRDVWILDEIGPKGLARGTGDKGKGVLAGGAEKDINMIPPDGTAHISGIKEAIMDDAIATGQG